MKKKLMTLSLLSLGLFALSASFVAISNGSFVDKALSDAGDYTITINPDDVTTNTESSNGQFTIKTDQLQNDVTFTFNNIKRDGNDLVMLPSGYIANSYSSQIRSIKTFTVYGEGNRFDYSYGWDAQGSVVDYPGHDYKYANGSDNDLSLYVPNYLRIEHYLVNLKISKIVIAYDRNCVAGENPVFAQDGLTYKRVNRDHAVLTGFSGESFSNIVVPDTVDGLPVTEIGDSAFSDDSEVRSVTFGANVTIVGENAFEQCINLQTLNGLDNLLVIEDSAFTKTGLSGDIVFSSTLTSIGKLAFSETNITSVTFSDDGNPYVYEGAFQNCEVLSSVYLGNQMNQFHDNLLNDEKLATITVGEENIKYSAIDNVLYDDEYQLVLVVATDRAETTLTIPSGYNLNQYCAYSNHNLETLVLNDDIKEIPDYAFGNCQNLTTIIFGYYQGITIQHAFENCDGLEELVIPGNVYAISQYAFAECDNLQTVIIEEGVERIDREAFYDCDALTTVVLPTTLTSLGQVTDSGYGYSDDVFNDCDNLMQIFTNLEDGYYEDYEISEGWKGERELAYYSEVEISDGYHWHYDNGVPVLW